MRVYWYWPFLRPEELPLARAFAARRHALTLHLVRGRLPVPADDLGLTVRADLEPAAVQRERSPAWLASRALTYPRRARQRARAVESVRPDVAHVVYLNYFTDGVALRRLARRTQVVSTVHDVVPHQSRVARPVERALLRLQYAAAGTIVVHHPDVGARLTAEFDVDPARIHHVPWAVPLVETSRLRTGSDRFVVLLFGTLRRNKGIDILLDAMDQIAERDVQVVIAGRGFADVEARVRAAAAHDTRVVSEIGPVSQARKQDLFRAADLVVLPYTSFASQSAVLHDAYAHHRPVLVTDVGALGSAVRADGTGWVVPPSDATALAEAVRDARRDEEARARAATAAAQAAERGHPDRVAARLEAVYEAIGRA